MDLKTAYNHLGIPEGTSKEDAKKAFKKAASKYHPDVNKDPGAEDQFKKINEAWQIVESGRGTDRPEQSVNYQDFNINDFISNFGINFGFGGPQTRQKANNFPEIKLEQTITFKDSVLGVTKDFKYPCMVRCEACHGAGKKQLDNGCAKCQGKGIVITQNGFTIVQQTCPDCKGKIKTENCSPCSSKGVISSERSISVNIPARVKNGNILDIGRAGHYINDMMGGTQVFIKINVTPQDDLKIENNDVLSSLKINLIEALEGIDKNVSTIDGPKKITITKLSKNKDEILIPNLGVERQGNHKVVIDVAYPENIPNLIQFLKEK